MGLHETRPLPGILLVSQSVSAMMSLQAIGQVLRQLLCRTNKQTNKQQTSKQASKQALPHQPLPTNALCLFRRQSSAPALTDELPDDGVPTVRAESLSLSIVAV